MPDTKKQKPHRSKGTATAGKKRGPASASKGDGHQAKRNQSDNGHKSRHDSSENAIDLLKTDHERVNSLFQDYETSGGEDKRTLAHKIMRELEIHATIEEEIFYPAFRERTGKEGKDLVTEAIEEHKQVKDLIQELRDLEPEDENFDAKFQDMMQDVIHHVDEEEHEMFPSAEEHLADELDQLGGEIKTRKQQLMESVWSGHPK